MSNMSSIQIQKVKRSVAIASSVGAMVGAIVGLLGALVLIRSCLRRGDRQPDDFDRRDSKVPIIASTAGSSPSSRYRTFLSNRYIAKLMEW